MLLTVMIELPDIFAWPPYDKGHLPRCVLMYSCAIFLRIKSLVLTILDIVECTATELSKTMKRFHESAQHGEMLSWLGFTEDHLIEAIELMYGQPSQEVMKPLRIVMAAVLDNSLLWLLQRPSFTEQVGKEPWSAYMEHILQDIVEYRTLKAKARGGSVVPDELVIMEIFDREEVRRHQTIVI